MGIQNDSLRKIRGTVIKSERDWVGCPMWGKYIEKFV